MDVGALLTIGALSERTGVAPSALRFYEAEGLIHADRTAAAGAAGGPSEAEDPPGDDASGS
jgi:hypothetical protein